MRRVFRLKITLSMIFMVLVVLSCKEKTPEKVDPGFGKYISAFTSGVVSVESPIRVRLAEDYAGEVGIGQEADVSLFRIKPKVEGKAYWINQRTLEFRPESRLKSDQVYEVAFQLAKLQEVPKKFEEMKFNFRTIRQTFTYHGEGLQAYDKQDMTLQKYKGYLATADVIEAEEIEKVLQTEHDGEGKPIRWEHAADGKMHYFCVDSIQRGEEKTELQMKWNGSAIGIQEKGSEKVEVPSLNLFKVMNVQVVQQPEQHVLIRFSDPLRKPQDLNGLIRLSGDQPLKFIIDGNEVKAFPRQRQAGALTLSVEEGIRNAMDVSLLKQKKFELMFQGIKPAVKLIGKGVIVPASNGLILPFEAVSLSSVDLRVIKIFEKNVGQFLQENQMDGSSDLRKVGRLILQKRIDLGTNQAIDLRRWNAFTLDLSKFIEVDPGAIYRVELRFRKEYSMYGCSDENQEDEDEAAMKEFQANQELEQELDSWDRPGWYESYYYPDGYSWSERDNPCDVSYYNSSRFVSRNIFASDLGLMAKAGNDKSITFAVTNLISAEPESGVELEVFNYQNQLMVKGQTDKDGLAKVNVDRMPYLLVAKKGNQRGYLRLDEGSALSLSNFDVGGQVVQKGIKGYIYGERGVWRPGDMLYLTFVMEDASGMLPENHPVIFELINPQGQTVTRKVSTSGTNGFYTFVTPTDAEAPTGNWTATINVGGVTFTKIIRIETVKPNRLKVNLDFDRETLQVNDNSQKATLEVKWLHGAVARNLKANVGLRFSTANTSFKGYPGYQFDDPSKEFYADEQVLFDGRIDQQGKAQVDLNLTPNHSAPGMLRANFITRVFEESGEYSIDMQGKLFAPYSSFVGLKMPESQRGWYLTDTPHQVEVATVDADGNPVSRKKLEVIVYKIDWRWWWDASEENLASYINRSSTRVVSRKNITTQNGKGHFELNIPYRSWRDYGRYLIRVVDSESGHSAGTTAYFSKWYGRAPEGMLGNATLLSFTSDKEKYNVGEKATITIPSSKSGKALVSLETGSKVLKAFWVDTDSKETQFSFEVTPEMAPNAYVHVSLIQPHAQTENDLPIRMYGVIPILVEDPGTRLNPVIDMPDVLEPEKEFEVKVSEKDGKDMTYTIAVVDDGLLDLTRFKTPNPWDVFFAREALGVKTWDLFDYVMGAYGARLERAFAIGGDEGLMGKKETKAQRFKPVVMFYGPFTLHGGDTKLHRITMPNYVGSVRTMVVAGNQKAYGSAEKTTTVRKPLMILATLPRVLGPDEKVKLPVTVFAMDPKVKKVNLKVEANELLSLEGPATKEITFEKTGEQIVNFDLKVAQKLGVGKVKVYAQSGDTRATYEIELEVRNPNPRVVNLSDTLLNAGQIWQQDIALPGMEGTNRGVLELSSIPPIDFGRRLDYLISYPHGCIEQTTSSVFPQLFLSKVIDLDATRTQEISENVQAGLNRLMSFQLPSGGFSYWPGDYEASDWGTSYAGHFLLKAEEAGYTLPIGLKSNWLKYQKTTAQNWESTASYRGGDYYKGNDLLQAYRLYTLALAQSPELGAMNRLRERSDLSEKARWRLAAAYQLIGQKEVAEKLIDRLPVQVEDYRELYGSFGSGTRDRAMILETLSMLDRKTEAFPLLEKIANELSGRDWMSTQTTAYCLLAVAEFAGKSANEGLNFEYAVNGGELQQMESNRPVVQIPLDVTGNKPSVKVVNQSQGVLYARVNVSGIPVVGDQSEVAKNLKMKVTYRNMKGEILDVAKLQQGTDFKAEITISHPGVWDDYRQMALTQIFPSGWEIVNTRFGEIDPDQRGDEPTYQDIRDDRVYTYFDLERSKTKTFTILLNAAYQGRYYLPTVSCEAMYDNRINARQPGRWIEVEK